MYLAEELPEHPKANKKILFETTILYAKSFAVLENSLGCWVKIKKPTCERQIAKQNAKRKSAS